MFVLRRELKHLNGYFLSDFAEKFYKFHKFHKFHKFYKFYKFKKDAVPQIRCFDLPPDSTMLRAFSYILNLCQLHSPAINVHWCGQLYQIISETPLYFDENSTIPQIPQLRQNSTNSANFRNSKTPSASIPQKLLNRCHQSFYLLRENTMLRRRDPYSKNKKAFMF